MNPRWLIVVLLLTGCSSESHQEEVASRPVRVMTVQPSQTNPSWRVPGEIKPRHETQLAFRVAGKVLSRQVEVGDSVTAGQTLARLEMADLTLAISAREAEAASARADLEQAVLEFKRIETLRRDNVSSRAEYDRRQTAVKAARARLNAVEAQRDQTRNQAMYATLEADFAGVVTAVDLEPGQLVAVGQLVMRLARAEEREVLVAVPENRLAGFDKAIMTVTVAALPGRSWGGKVREMASMADVVTRTYGARIALVSGDPLPSLGMSATVTVSTEEAPSLLLPLSALYTRDDTPSVWVLGADNQTVRRVKVTTGGMEGNLVRVTAGVEPGEQVVIAGANLIREGQSVRVLEGKP